MLLTRLDEIVLKGDRTLMPNLGIPAKAEPGLSLEEMKQFVRNHHSNSCSDGRSRFPEVGYGCLAV